jgi:hypothetical protein
MHMHIQLCITYRVCFTHSIHTMYIVFYIGMCVYVCVCARVCVPSAGQGYSWSIGGGQSAQQKETMDAVLTQLSSSLSRHGGPFLMGSQPTLADILVYPFLRRYQVRPLFFDGAGLRYLVPQIPFLDCYSRILPFTIVGSGF